VAVILVLHFVFIDQFSLPYQSVSFWTFVGLNIVMMSICGTILLFISVLLLPSSCLQNVAVFCFPVKSFHPIFTYLFSL
jgi:hypothetical protein